MNGNDKPHAGVSACRNQLSFAAAFMTGDTLTLKTFIILHYYLTVSLAISIVQRERQHLPRGFSI